MWIQRWNFAQEFRSNLSPMILFSLSYACSLFRFLILTWKILSGKSILSGLPSALRHFCWKKIWLIFQWHIVASASKWSNNCYLSFFLQASGSRKYAFILTFCIGPVKVDFHRRVIFTCVHVTRVNKIEAIYGMSRVNVRVELRSSLHAVFHTLPLFYLRA